MTLNKIQQEAMDCLENGMNVLITGPAGSGKSKVIEDFYNSSIKNMKYYQKGSIVKTSTTGSSALLIGGFTLHSYLGIGLGKADVSTLISNIRKNKTIRERWTRLKTLIIDEVSMLSAELLDKLDDIGKTIRKDYMHIFGGIQIVLVGDFCQLPIIGSTKFCFESERWNDIVEHVIYFKEIIRQNDPVYQKCLNEIRMGECSIETIEILASRMNAKTGGKDVEPTMLYSRKADVERINTENFDKLIEDGKEVKTYKATYMTEGKMTKANVETYMEKLDKSCPAENNLKLCIGAQVMIIANNSEEKVVNGSRGVISGFDGEQPIIKLIDGREINIEKHTWSMEVSDNKIIKKIQYPIKLAYAITIHKSQGMTLDCVETDIGNSVFEYGQVYVVLSRVKSLDGLSLKKFSSKKIKIHPKVKEFYKSC
jgi:ATP-dependent DNA helicase PIF1